LEPRSCPTGALREAKSKGFQILPSTTLTASRCSFGRTGRLAPAGFDTASPVNPADRHPVASAPTRCARDATRGRDGRHVSPFGDDATRLRRHPDAFSRDLEVDGLPVGSRCKNQPRIYPSGTMSRIGANFSFTIRENSRNSWQEITICS